MSPIRLALLMTALSLCERCCASPDDWVQEEALAPAVHAPKRTFDYPSTTGAPALCLHNICTVEVHVTVQSAGGAG